MQWGKQDKRGEVALFLSTSALLRDVEREGTCGTDEGLEVSAPLLPIVRSGQTADHVPVKSKEQVPFHRVVGKE